MPDPMPPAAPTNPVPLASSTPPSTPPTPPAPAPKSEPFRFASTENVEPWARGKTADEVLAITKGLMDNFHRTNYAPAASAPPAPAAPAAEPQLDPEAFLTGREAMALADRIVARLESRGNPATDAAASAVYGMATLRHPKEFSRYEPEIMGYLTNLPKASWTLDNLDKIVKIVRGDHIADYRSDWEQEFVGKLDPTMRSTGDAGSGPPPTADKSQSLESEKIPSDWKARAAKAGITESTVEEFCRANEMSRENFFKLFESGKIVTEVA